MIVRNEITLPEPVEPTQVIALLESVCEELGLTCALKSPLKTYPGSLHWHYRKEKSRGTLELTLLPEQPRLWIKISANRRAAWIEDIVPLVKHRLETVENRTEDKTQ